MMSSASDPPKGAKNPHAQILFDRGNDAALKANFDYAIQMYSDACKMDPLNLLFRQHLRGIERRKFGNDPSKVGRLVGARAQPIRLRARSAKSKGNHAQVLEICEEAFAINPWDVHAAREAAEAAVQLGGKDVAQWLIDSAFANATDADFFRYAAQVYELNSNWPRAIASWERVKQIHPNDEDASRQINGLSANATIQRSGLGESLNRQAASAQAALVAEAEELKQPQLTPEQRWEKEIGENPAHAGPYLQYAEHLRARGHLDLAQKQLARGLKAAPDDPSLQYAHAEVQIARLQRALNDWTLRARQAPHDAEAQAKLAQVQGMLNEYEIKEYRRRAGLQPGDTKLQYQLGLRLARAGMHKDAITAFQAARSGPAEKVESLHQLGLSFEAEGAQKLAERSYSDALKAADAHDTTLLNALHYRLGRVYEAMGNTAAAEEHYNEVAANDYGYLDVAARLRALN